MHRYGKPSAPLLRRKTRYLEENSKLAAHTRSLCELYAKQPMRTNCMICDGNLEKVAFTKLQVDYLFCEHCGHLNGAHEDTDEFCQAVYTDDRGATYADTYKSVDRKDYESRVEDIYLPKVDFLIEALEEAGEKPDALSYADFGAGSGYFVAALMKRTFERVTGYEVSMSQVRLANAMIGDNRVIQHDLMETVRLAKTVRAGVVSMIGTLEHFQNPREVLLAFNANDAVRYLYLSVPLFSPCVFLELAFPDVFHRQLAGAHTHLFTARSIEWMCGEYGLERLSEWWFGTDMVDLYRNIYVSLEQQNAPGAIKDAWAEMMLPALDGMQRVLDEQNTASEVHMLLRKFR